MSAREQQLEELQALHAIFDSDLKVRAESVARFLHDGDPGFLRDSERLEFDLRIELHADGDEELWELPASAAPAAITFHCELPLEYPAAAAYCRVSGALEGVQGALPGLNAELRQMCAEAAERGEEGAIYGLAMHAKQAAEDAAAEAAAAASAMNAKADMERAAGEAGGGEAHGGPGSEEAGGEPEGSAARPLLTRRFFWTHHTWKKQKLMWEWAGELRVSGRVSVSQPGYTFVEGAPEDIKEFTRRNMGENWKVIRITWDEEVWPESGAASTTARAAADHFRLFGDGWKETDLDGFIAEMRALGPKGEEILEHGSRGVLKAT